MFLGRFIPYAANIYPISNNDKVFMRTANLIENSEKTANLQLSWQDSLPVQRLLDVIAEIIASEYVQIAKQNPEVFLSSGAHE